MMEKVKEILKNYTEVSEENITAEATLQGDLELNSLDVMNIVIEFEDAFGIEIADSDVVDFVTVGDVVDFLQKKNL